ncbi:MAG: GGDEF domain-containing protein [Methylococcales bacterium]|nr:diguanylate cyclase [Methylococcaceae bacterium]
MKKLNLNSGSYNFVSSQPDNLIPQSSRQEGDTDSVYAQLQHSILEINSLKQALTTSQGLANDAQEQIESFAETNAKLKQKLIRLARKCAHARHFGYHDELTGLPNRSLLMDRLKQAIVQSARQHKQVVLLFIDLDKFKDINDNFGHEGGDKILQQVAGRLSACLRYGDTASRYGGDEFVIMLPEMEGHENIAVVKEKIRATLSAAYELDGQAIELSASMGSAVYRNDGQDCSDLIKQADAAMYLAKAYSVPIRSV